MAVSAVILKDTDFETVVKVTTTGTNSAASIVDASALDGASSNPRLVIVACSCNSSRRPLTCRRRCWFRKDQSTYPPHCTFN